MGERCGGHLEQDIMVTELARHWDLVDHVWLVEL
jgi:cytochrome bd-type quinol oxidase subunit 2